MDLVLCCILAGCDSQDAAGSGTPTTPQPSSVPSASIQYRGDKLTGNTGLVADMIANATGGDLFSILTAEQYPDNYNDTIEMGQAEDEVTDWLAWLGLAG